MFPLPLRNALAGLAIDALDDDTARAALGWLAARGVAPAPATLARLARVHLVDGDVPELLAVHAPHDAGIRAHATHALAAADVYRRRPLGRPDTVDGALVRAAALWDARLFFEVHEVLEAVWQRTTGDVRQALQGVIQMAVAFYHLAAGNLRGARQLLADGRERLAATEHALPLLDAQELLARTAPWQDALAAHRPVHAASAPRFALRAAADPPSGTP
jgi:predicted metal-dependent hydrolase